MAAIPIGARTIPEKTNPSVRTQLLCLAGLVAAGVVVYANSFQGAFLFDDRFNILDSARVQTLWPPVWLRGQRPVVNLTLALNRALGGENVWGYHLLNLSVHIVAGFLLYGIVRRSAGRRRSPAAAIVFAFVVSLIWLVHPLQTQSVTYIIQRAESLMGMLYLLTLYGAVRATGAARRGSRIRWSLLSAGALALALGAKPVALTAPVMIVLYDCAARCDARPSPGRRRWVLYLALFGIVAVVLLRSPLRQVFTEPATLAAPGAPVTVGVGAGGIGAWDYLRTQAGVIVHYLRLAIWPDRLVLDYAWPISRTMGDVLPQGVLMVALLIATLIAWRYHRWLGFAGAWFFVTLAPTSSIVPIVDPAFEHRMYLPLAAIIVVGVAGVAGAVSRGARWMHATPRVTHGALALLTVMTVILLGGRTIARNRDYRDPVTCWRRNAADRPRNPRAHNNLCQALNDAGRNNDALVACDAALRLVPEYADAHNNRANVLLALGRTAEAADACRRALATREDFADAHVTLGFALYLLGDYDGAIAQEERALALAPRSIRALNNLGNALARKGATDAALEAFARALEVDARDAETHNNIAWVHAAVGDLPRAVNHFEHAVARDPQLFAAWFNLAQVYERMQRVDDARRAYAAALRIVANQGDADQARIIRERIAALAPR